MASIDELAAKNKSAVRTLFVLLKGLGIEHAARSVDITNPSMEAQKQPTPQEISEALATDFGKQLLVELTPNPLSPAPVLESDINVPMCWYFAYGSNMSEEQSTVRLNRTHGRKLLRLDNHVLFFNKPSALEKGISYANVEPIREGMPELTEHHRQHPEFCDKVYGIGYLLTMDQLLRMDYFEGMHKRQYSRHKVMCKWKNEETGAEEDVLAHIYFADGTGDGLPSKEYLSRITEGEDLLPKAYAEWLKSHPTSGTRSPRQDARLRKEL